MRNLHYFLFVGETGLIVNGWMGFGLLLGASVISLDEVVANGSKELPQQPLSYVQLPVDPDAGFTVIQYPQGAAP